MNNTKPKKVGAVTIYTGKSNRNWISYTVTWRRGGARHRRSFSDYDLALKEANQINELLNRGHVSVTGLPAATLSYYHYCQSLLGDVPLDAVIRDYLSRNPADKPSPKLDAVLPDYLASLTSRQLSKRHVETCRAHLTRLSKHFQGPIGSITTEQLQAYLDSQEWAPKTRLQHRTTIRAFWSWAERHGHLKCAKPAVQLSRPKVLPKTPDVFTAEQIHRLLREASFDLRAAIALGAFGGIRSAEIARLRWADINWNDAEIWLDPAITKTSRRRRVPLTANLLRWLAPCRQSADALIVPTMYYARLRALTELVGLKWVANGLRYSFTSYHLAVHNNAPLTAQITGHTVEILETTYKGRVAKEDAALWFEITPGETFSALRARVLGAAPDKV